jgi:prepilin-type N-terminal cleavage/methylation domain-containing protein
MKTRRQGFTLLEVIIAVMLIAMVAVTIQRFVGATMTGISVSTERQQDVETMNALFRYVKSQLDELPVHGQTLIMGYEHLYGTLHADELQLRCSQGEGTLTGAAEGEWFVTLTLREQQENRRKLDLGLIRRPADGSNDKDLNWIPLVRDVAGLKFEYFDPRLNAWQTKWNDQSSKPLLVRMQVWRTPDSVPELAVFTINASLVQQ